MLFLMRLMVMTLMMLLMGAVIATILLLRRILPLLWLGSAFLLGSLMQGGGEIFQGSNEMMAEVAFGFVGFFNRFGDSFDGTGELIEGGLDSLEAGRNTAEEFILRIRF